MEEKIRDFFICIHNNGRSQIAETFLKDVGSDRFEAGSTGFDPRPINPYVIEVMKEGGYDMSANTSDSVLQFFKEGRLYDYVITVCNDSIEDECPTFPISPKDCTGPFPIPRRQQEQRKKNRKTFVPSEMISNNRLSPGLKDLNYDHL